MSAPRTVWVVLSDSGSALDVSENEQRLRSRCGEFTVAAYTLAAEVATEPKHLRECGTQYRGCAPGCPFDAQHGAPEPAPAPKREVAGYVVRFADGRYFACGEHMPRPIAWARAWELRGKGRECTVCVITRKVRA